MKKYSAVFIFVLVFFTFFSGQKTSIHRKMFTTGRENFSYQIALLKYNGGGDWYANLETSLPNLINFCNSNLKTTINPEQAIVEAGSADIFNYPFLHMTGHGNVVFSDLETQNLRNYLMSGGFLHVDDNYGMDKFIRPQLKRIFPDCELLELPYSHPIYHQLTNKNCNLRFVS